MKHEHPVAQTVMRVTAVTITAFLLGRTSTAQHTNVLVFGTNTKVALDLLQDATSGIGITLCCKRQEAVWMPLLPNQAATNGNGLQPSPCTTIEGYPKFVGMDSNDQYDTHTVLARFGTKLGAGVDSTGKDAKGNGEIAQHFATGLAARILAQNGAALVSTIADSLTSDERKQVKIKVKKNQDELDELLEHLADKTDSNKVDPAKVAAAFVKVPGKDIGKVRQERIKATSQIADLKRALTAYSHADDANRMLDTLNAN